MQPGGLGTSLKELGDRFGHTLGKVVQDAELVHCSLPPPPPPLLPHARAV